MGPTRRLKARCCFNRTAARWSSGTSGFGPPNVAPASRRQSDDASSRAAACCGNVMGTRRPLRLRASTKGATVMRWIGLAAALVALQTATGSGRATAPDEPFVAAPYVQIGETPGLLRWEKLDVLWHTADRDAAWRVEYRMDGDPRWHRASASVLRRVAMHGVDPHRVYRATLRDLRSGAPVSYRVLRDGAVVFEASTRARPARTSAFRAVIVGDCADGSAAQRLTAFRMAAEKPDLIVVPGDIVYGQGTIGQYRSKYFPVYNAGAAAADTGAPIARTTPIVGVLGNHDVGGAALDRYADGLAYYLFFSQPMNGPKLDPGGPHATPVRGPGDAVAAFL
ncbi:MAG: hypothetical protein FJX72_10570, partial [Armatimonadetes bacterium]|nr:hypothetical protein [Armatimonadota bacterium]